MLDEGRGNIWRFAGWVMGYEGLGVNGRTMHGMDKALAIALPDGYYNTKLAAYVFNV